MGKEYSVVTKTGVCEYCYFNGFSILKRLKSPIPIYGSPWVIEIISTFDLKTADGSLLNQVREFTVSGDFDHNPTFAEMKTFLSTYMTNLVTHVADIKFKYSGYQS